MRENKRRSRIKAASLHVGIRRGHGWDEGWILMSGGVCRRLDGRKVPGMMMMVMMRSMVGW